MEVPIGNRVSLGVVWDGTPAPLPEKAKLKDVIRRCDAPPIQPVLRKLVDWVAGYTLNPTGAVLKMCLPEPRALVEPPPLRTVLRLGDAAGVKMSDQRERVLEIVREQPGMTVTELAEAAAVSQAVVRKLIELGALQADQVPAFRPPPPPDWQRVGRKLNTLQGEAAAALRSATERGISRSRCWRASPARAKRKCITKRCQPRCRWVARYWCCCRKSR